MKKTLSLTGLTINAMALIAPGAFLWTTFQLQSAQANAGTTTAFDMLPGLLFVLVLAFLTAYSYSELANAYPQAGAGSSYYFAEAAFLEKEKKAHYQFARLSKFTVGWISHLYYWIYPGIMVAFTGVLTVFILSLFNITLTTWQSIIPVVLFAALTGYIAFRGISGSTMTAIIINVIQLTALVAFAILAIVFRATHPELNYAHPNPFSVVLPHGFGNVLMQGTIAILLLVGFESVTALGAEAKNPKRDVRRAILLSLAIQGAVAYVIEYFAANYFMNDQITNTVNGTVNTGYAAAAVSGAPIADMITYIGNNMLGGTGLILTAILAATVLIALIGTTLACLNTGVRITYVMGRDGEMPSILGLLHGKFATPHFGVLILAVISAVIGAYGVLSVDNLTQITLASNTGTFLVYGMTNLICIIAFASRRDRHVLKHYIVPGLGLLANLGMLFAIFYLNIFVAGGATATDTIIALGIVVVWLLAGVIWMVVNSAVKKQPLLHDEHPGKPVGEEEETAPAMAASDAGGAAPA
ncbi:MAG: APC family permease [Candidatus Dormibacteraeota bacterium]|nr:APC family permease [Candidatus Dormibacteraeota bacterium]